MIKPKDVSDAYRKFKSFVYYDNTSLLLRKQLAEFEVAGDFETRLKIFADEVSQYEGDAGNDYWKSLLNRINYWTLVKSFNEGGSRDAIISNSEQEKNYRAERYTYLINAPIELHLLCILWLVKVGYKLETKLKVEPYGNKIELDSNDKPVNGLRLFKPYFKEYQKWRDGAIEAAKKLVNKKKDALIIGLDIKDCYHSVRLNAGLVLNDLSEDNINLIDRRLTKLVFEIHKKYTKTVPFESGSDQHGDKYILPIGLMSSAVLANWYLRDLDNVITDKLKPDFYGRYVDDLLIVLQCQSDQEIKSTDGVIKQYFVRSDILKKQEQDDGEACYLILPERYEQLKIQQKKFTLMHFDHTEPTALLDKFEKELRKLNSEYRFLPDEDTIIEDFDEAAYSLSYAGTKNKLRNIKEFNEDKFGVSKFLAKEIFFSLQSDLSETADQKLITIEKISRFFKHKRCIELMGVWEKVATYFVINNEVGSLLNFTKAVCDAIGGIDIESSQVKQSVKQSYMNHFIAALEMALSLRPTIFITDYFERNFKKNVSDYHGLISPNISLSINNFRISNLIRHHYVVYPLLNYTKLSIDDTDPTDLVAQEDYFRINKKENLIIDKRMFKYSPRFVHFHEVTLFHIFQRINSAGNGGYGAGLSLEAINDDYLNSAFDDYYRLTK